MNKYDIIIKNIKDNLYKGDKQLSNVLIPIYIYLNKKVPKYRGFFVELSKCEKILLPLLFNNLNNKECILFFIRTSLIKIDDNRFQNFDQYMTNIFRNYIAKHTKDFLEIVKNNEDIQKLYLNWFKIKEYNTCFKNDFYNEIFNLPKFKEIILEDEKFILNNFFLSLDFYDKLPKEYGYLIGLIKSKNIPIKTTLKLYNKFFDGLLYRSDQLKLLKTSIQMDNYDFSFEIDNNNKILEFAHCLKKIYQNKKYYNILKKLSKKRLTKNEINKIKYLSISEKILDNNVINNLNNISLNDLINAEKETGIEIGIYGGPNSKNNNNPLFSIDSSSKEIRRINTDGSIDIKKLDSYGSHSLGIDLIYPELEFNYNDAVFEKAISAIKELDSITLIIEGEACLIVISKDISDAQKNILTNWINESRKESNIAINIYDKATDKNEMLLCNEIGKKDIVKYISNLNDNKKYTHNM